MDLLLRKINSSLSPSPVGNNPNRVTMARQTRSALLAYGLCKCAVRAREKRGRAGMLRETERECI